MISAYILIDMKPGNFDNAINSMRKIENITKISVVAGEYDIVVRAQVTNLDRLLKVTNKIQLIDGVEYEVKVLRYQESVKSLGDNKMQRVRSYANGEVETSVIDIRSNQVLESSTMKRTLSDAELKAIESSPYKKKIFITG